MMNSFYSFLTCLHCGRYVQCGMRYCYLKTREQDTTNAFDESMREITTKYTHPKVVNLGFGSAAVEPLLLSDTSLHLFWEVSI